MSSEHRLPRDVRRLLSRLRFARPPLYAGSLNDRPAHFKMPSGRPSDAVLPAGVYVSDGQGHVTSPDPSHSWSWGALRASASECERAGLVAAAQTLRDVSEALFPVLAALSAMDTGTPDD